MASFCWSCSSKLRPAQSLLHLPSPSISLSAPFHTTAPSYALSPVVKGRQTRSPNALGHRFREPRNKPIHKGKRHQRRFPRDPIRMLKEVKNRIVLSNANALEVAGLQDMSLESMLDNRLRGKVVGLPMNMLDRLRAVQAFHRTQKWHLFRRPATLVRRETLELGKEVSRIGPGKTVAKVVTGERGTGKSLYLLQAMAMGFLKNWVVINIPSAQDLVIAHTAYAPLPDVEPLQYVQKNATAQLLTRIATANESVLSSLHLSQSHPKLKAPFTPQMSLHTLATMGAQDPEVAWPVFEALWKELTATGPAEPPIQGQKAFKPRPPMIVTMDDVDHWMRETKYKSPDFEPVHAHDLVLVSHFLNVLTGKAPLPAGGVVLAATTRSNFPRIYKFDVALQQIAARQAGIEPESEDFPHLNPYIRGGERVTELFSSINSDLDVLELKGLSKEEAKGLMEYFAYSGLFREKVSEENVSEKWTLAAGGVVGELEKLGMRLRNLPVDVRTGASSGSERAAAGAFA